MHTIVNGSWDIISVPKLHLTLTICFTVFYSLIFIMSYIQLWLVLYLGNKLISAQNIYFLLCCLFTSQRIVLFCFFYNTDKNNDRFHAFVGWFLISFPILIQYLIVLLITVFYYRTYVKTKGMSSKLNRYQYSLISIPIVFIFVLNLLPIFFKNENKKEKSLYFPILAVTMVMTDIIFIGTISVFVYIYRQFPKFINATLIHEAKRITRTRCIIVGFICISVCILKLVYDILALLTTQKDIGIKLPTGIEKENFISTNNDQRSFIIFGSVLFLWEVIPLIAALIIFRVRFPKGIFNMGKVHSNKDFNSNSHLNSTMTNSSSTSRSRFIGVPNYKSFNRDINSVDASSGPFTPNLFVSPRTFLRHDDYSYENDYTSRNILRSNFYGGSNSRITDGNIQAKSYKQNFSRLSKPAVRRIWRSSSNKCLVPANTIEESGDPRTNSAQLSTATEE